MPWNLGSKTITRVWQFIDQFTVGETIDRADHDVALADVTSSVNSAIAYLIAEIEDAASSELYLGVAASPPTVNNAGAALVAGNLYIKSPEYDAFVWTGTEWTLAEQFAAASSYFKGLVTAVDAGALRSLLGLGSAATFASTSFATAAEIAVEAERLTNSIRPVTTGGSGNAFTIVSNDPITAYADQQAWILRADRAPTGAATLNVDALGAKDIKKIDASNSLIDIASGDWGIGDLIPVFYDGTRMIVPKYGLLKAGAALALASEAEAEAGTSSTTLMTPERTEQHSATRPRVWAMCAFNGTASTPISVEANGFNVTNVTKNATGDYTINFAAAVPNANYAVLGVCVQSATDANLVVNFEAAGSRAVGSVRIVVEDRSGILRDSALITVTVIGIA